MRVLALCLLAACGSPSNNGNPDASIGDHGDGHGSGSGYQDAPVVAAGRTVFVIPLENKPSAGIYGNTTNAPYINGLMPTAAYATKFKDELPSLDSEPHYIWMEAGTNVFTDRSFTTDNDSSPSNSTATTDHLTAQLNAANVPWMSYQEDITAGTCPIASTAEYAAKHDPFVFFQDIVGSPPSASNAGCIAHHKPYSQFAADLATGMTGFVFITPNLCHDMHGDPTCSVAQSSRVSAGDAWLAALLPRLTALPSYRTGKTLIVVTFDEGSEGNATGVDCTDPAYYSMHVDCHIATIVLSAYLRPGAVDSGDHNLYGLLGTFEDVLGYPRLGRAVGASSLRPGLGF